MVDNIYSMNELIDNLDVSDSWKKKFKKMHTVYDKNYSCGIIKSPFNWKPNEKFKTMSYSERRKVVAAFNFWAFLFGVFYYFAKGMWKQGFIWLFIIVAVSLLLTSVFHLSSGLGYGASVIYALSANRDYFYHKVINNPEIKKLILENKVI